LKREAVIEAALNLLNAGGIDGVTTRRLISNIIDCYPRDSQRCKIPTRIKSSNMA